MHASLEVSPRSHVLALQLPKLQRWVTGADWSVLVENPTELEVKNGFEGGQNRCGLIKKTSLCQEKLVKEDQRLFKLGKKY